MADWNIVSHAQLAGSGRLDAEFYQPALVRNHALITAGAWDSLGALSSSLRKGVFYILASEYVAEGVAFYRSSNVGFLVPDEEGLVFIDGERHAEEAKTALAAGDLILAKTGRPGASVIMRDSCNCSQDVIALKVNRDLVDPYYLAAFLNSTPGKLEMQRWFQGQVQPHLSLPDARSIAITKPPPAVQRRVRRFVREAHEVLRSSGNKYEQAELELLQRLDWEGFTEAEPSLRERGFIGSYGATLAAGRADAEHFHPHIARLRRHIDRLGGQLLGTFCESPRRGIQPAYDESGTVQVVTSKHLGPTEIDMDSLDRTSVAFYESDEAAHARLREGDVLLYATGAYVGRTNPWRGSTPAIASNHVTIIRSNPDICEPVYLALFLNSVAGIDQSEAHATGSAQRELYPGHVEKLMVFVPRVRGVVDLDFQRRLSGLVTSATEARSRSRALLREAVAEVDRFLSAGNSASSAS